MTTDIDTNMTYPASLVRTIAGHDPHDWQDRLFRSTATRSRVDCHRRSGKSTAAVALAIDAAVSRDDALVLLVSATGRQSNDLFRKVVLTCEVVGRPTSAYVGGTRMMSLANGSRIVCLSADVAKSRGYWPHLVVIDDVEFISDEVRDAILSTLAVSGGRLIELASLDEEGPLYRSGRHRP